MFCWCFIQHVFVVTSGNKLSFLIQNLWQFFIIICDAVHFFKFNFLADVLINCFIIELREWVTCYSADVLLFFHVSWSHWADGEGWRADRLMRSPTLRLCLSGVTLAPGGFCPRAQVSNRRIPTEPALSSQTSTPFTDPTLSLCDLQKTRDSDDDIFSN